MLILEMEISPRRSMSLDLDISVVSPTASSYPPTYVELRNWRAKMYTIKSNPEVKLQKPYRTISSLSVDSPSLKAPETRKENIFTSMFGALTSIVVERFGKVPSTFMSNIHNTLSVTVVPNEGIISQEFFKNLTRNCEQLAIEQNKDLIENSRITEKLQNKSMYDFATPMSYVFTNDMKKIPLSTKVSLNSEGNITNELDWCRNINETTKLSKSPIVPTEIFNELDVIIPLKSSEKGPQNCSENILTSRVNTMEGEEISMPPPKPDELTEELTDSKKINPAMSTAHETQEDQNTAKIAEERYCNRWQAMWDKVVNGMSERFGTTRAVSPDSEVPTKKPNLSKPSRRKTCTIARIRGKGRGKSQLRRNGVSQSRHRKERTKQNIYSNIQDDLNAWEDEDERYAGSEDDESSVSERSTDQVDSASFDPRDQPNSSLSRHCSTLFENLSFDVTSQARKQKQGLRNSPSNCPMRVRYVPESSMEVENHNSSYSIDNSCASRLGEYRPRLVSESSVDSEDSYCIVFENGSESEYTDYDDDEVSDTESDATTDDDIGDDGKQTLRVRFNLEPQVHTMIKWNYAYRAARRGPWEEMARDRERFRGRIHRTERILSPILSVQHRNQIWQKRFDVDE
ncbi:uncharacterized protein PPP1R15 [Venturia canescens]|uniref:uncharacterized protein PPP1R15 n=1 Tax=Venturia canescens TaxID=32260 RepID=UPI001C9D37A6|nr:uncharacterized protein LOC122416231 [Venturia canescens]